MISTIILIGIAPTFCEKPSKAISRRSRASFELFIVDNASTDASHDYLRELDSQGQATVLFLERTSEATRSIALYR